MFDPSIINADGKEEKVLSKERNVYGVSVRVNLAAKGPRSQC